MKKIIFTIIISIFVLTPICLLAQENNNQAGERSVFQAKVIQILKEEQIKNNEQNAWQQKLKLIGLEDPFKNQEIIFDGFEYQLTANNHYQVGDKVLVEHSQNPNGKEIFFVTDYVRHKTIYWLFAIFAFIILLIGKSRGLRAIIGLIFSFFVIIKFIIPAILNGKDPLLSTLFFSLIIVLVSTYITYGLNKKSSLAIAGTLSGLFFVGILSLIFTNTAKLSGLADDQVLFLIGTTESALNLQGLLLAGIIIGALGVLDDLTVSQVSTVKEISLANPSLSTKELYKKAMQVGIDHIASMVNTLFLAYAGASLSLLLLFGLNQEPFLSITDVINHEVIATEIVRTLVGSIGLALAVPITTWMAAKFYQKKIKNT